MESLKRFYIVRLPLKIEFTLFLGLIFPITYPLLKFVLKCLDGSFHGLKLSDLVHLHVQHHLLPEVYYLELFAKVIKESELHIEILTLSYESII